MIDVMEPEICKKMLKKLSEKFGAKFPATTHGYSMLKFARLGDAFVEVFLTASKTSRRPAEDQSPQQKEKKRRKRESKKKKNQKSKSLKTHPRTQGLRSL